MVLEVRFLDGWLPGLVLRERSQGQLLREEGKMNVSTIRERVVEEVKLIPDHKLMEIYELIHYFRVGLQSSGGTIDQVAKFAGCWASLPEDTFREFSEEIAQRRSQAFSRRRSSESSLGGY